MYRALILFETDSDRKFQMYRRSAQLLEPIYKDLNPQPYLLICRQLTFELGEIYSAMADLKLSKFNSTPGHVDGHNALTNNINKLISMAQFSFLSFLGTLKTEEGTFPEKFSEDTCRPALLAMLNLARVADKVYILKPYLLKSLKSFYSQQIKVVFKRYLSECSELRCIPSYLAFFLWTKVSILGTQFPKYLWMKRLQTGSYIESISLCSLIQYKSSPSLKGLGIWLTHSTRDTFMLRTDKGYFYRSLLNHFPPG